MIINFVRGMFFHSDCADTSGGIMKELSFDADKQRGVIECLSCGQRGYLPVGSAGEICVEEAVRGDKDSLTGG